MPNWCASNFVLEGNKEELERFCKTVNGCLAKPDIKKNGFGKLWLGNLCEAFGYDYEQETERGYNLRGTLDTNPDSVACFFGPDPETETLTPHEHNKGLYRVEFSTQTAWGPSDWFIKMLRHKFPHVTYGFKATDEFGNFHCVVNPKLLNCPRYEITIQNASPDVDYVEGNAGDEEKIAKILANFTGKPFTTDHFKTKKEERDEWISDWNQNNEDNYIEFIEWEETN